MVTDGLVCRNYKREVISYKNEGLGVHEKLNCNKRLKKVRKFVLDTTVEQGAGERWETRGVACLMDILEIENFFTRQQSPAC